MIVKEGDLFADGLCPRQESYVSSLYFALVELYALLGVLEVVTLSKTAYSATLAGYSNPTLQLIDPFIADGEHVRSVIQGIPSCSVVSAINFIADK